MRISDWSSDVCSSDLHGGEAGGAVDAFEGDQHQDDGGDQQLVGHRIEETAEIRHLAPFAGEIAIEPVGDAGGGGQRQEIGRASGRARVCMYGWISGVGVYLKKKKK